VLTGGFGNVAVPAEHQLSDGRVWQQRRGDDVRTGLAELVIEEPWRQEVRGDRDSSTVGPQLRDCPVDPRLGSRGEGRDDRSAEPLSQVGSRPFHVGHRPLVRRPGGRQYERVVRRNRGLADTLREHVDQYRVRAQCRGFAYVRPGGRDRVGDVDVDVVSRREQYRHDDCRSEVPQHVGELRPLDVDVRLDDGELRPQRGDVFAELTDCPSAGRVARAMGTGDEGRRVVHGTSMPAILSGRRRGWLWSIQSGMLGHMAGRDTGRSFGIDIGGSGIKGAPVDLRKGEFAAERVRIDTPEASTPENVIDVVMEVISKFDWDEPFCCAFPAVVHHGVIRSAANVDKSWIGVDLQSELRQRTGQPVVVVNDADAAGVAEGRFGAAAGVDGVVVLTTLGTGIGSAVLLDGALLPNTEFGHIYLEGGKEAEEYAGASVREEKDLSWAAWAGRLQKYYSHLEFILSPELFVVGGGVSKRADKFLPLLDLQTPIVPAKLLNDAGIIGAALLAVEGAPE
jgi:polyphosphate glucokinase